MDLTHSKGRLRQSNRSHLRHSCLAQWWGLRHSSPPLSRHYGGWSRCSRFWAVFKRQDRSATPFASWSISARSAHSQVKNRLRSCVAFRKRCAIWNTLQWSIGRWQAVEPKVQKLLYKFPEVHVPTLRGAKCLPHFFDMVILDRQLQNPYFVPKAAERDFLVVCCVKPAEELLDPRSPSQHSFFEAISNLIMGHGLNMR